jgi:hypothetical protein
MKALTVFGVIIALSHGLALAEASTWRGRISYPSQANLS